jgi:hypothetical protein
MEPKPGGIGDVIGAAEGRREKGGGCSDAYNGRPERREALVRAAHQRRC